MLASLPTSSISERSNAAMRARLDLGQGESLDHGAIEHLGENGLLASMDQDDLVAAAFHM
eukprot:CAMPEP_0115289782 /NCGR_PEP_ID=MMETSP0270-20121206/63691_1 /TAXON_ID=71861 /ORGANISM="Scrippsiella trochoidea, Strain CCMP3099" /LENGTH=59 /DNA_ID=CAMNT_0002706981 /DNA_START=3 /DNA_END=179 /DNA_ORIENTATION=+